MIQVEDIYAVRKKLGLSQEKLAEALGVSRNSVSRWERGEFRPSAENLAALERLLVQLEGGPAAPEETPAPKQEPAPPPVKVKRWPLVLLCIGVLCTLLIGILSLAGIHSIQRRLDPQDTAVPMEDLDVEEVDEVLIISSADLQPLQP